MSYSNCPRKALYIVTLKFGTINSLQTLHTPWEPATANGCVVGLLTGDKVFVFHILFFDVWLNLYFDQRCPRHAIAMWKTFVLFSEHVILSQ